MIQVIGLLRFRYLSKKNNYFSLKSLYPSSEGYFIFFLPDSFNLSRYNHHMFDKLKERYGEGAGAQRGNDCFKNAVHNAALAIQIRERPFIYDVITPSGRHAYLGNIGGQIVSLGFTWTTDAYPEITKDQLIKLGGVDVTKKLLSQALKLDEDIYGYHRVLNKLEVRIPGITNNVYNNLKKL